MTFGRGDLLWMNFNPQKGREQTGRRPALTISTASYNALSQCMLVCPITSNTAPWPWKVLLPEGLPASGAVLVDQMKSLDIAARDCAPMGAAIPEHVMDEVLARLSTLTA